MTTKRGRRPKPPHLHLVDGTFRPGRHGDKAAATKPDTATMGFGKIKMPAHFVGHAAEAWKKYVAPAFWLDASLEPVAIAFCELWQEFCLAPPSFRPAKHSAMRAIWASLA
jgi:hypothetical protein